MSFSEMGVNECQVPLESVLCKSGSNLVLRIPPLGGGSVSRVVLVVVIAWLRLSLLYILSFHEKAPIHCYGRGN